MKITKNGLSAFVLPVITITLVGNLASCGTIIYPDRNGQKAGDLDPLVVVLDGVGLLFFLIPGVIAFAVDFNNHSIYLPHGHHRSGIGAAHSYSQNEINGKWDRAAIEDFIRTQTGTSVSLKQSDLQVIKLDSIAELDAKFALYGQDVRVASIR